MGIEPTSSAWKADILADVLYPQLRKILYHSFVQMSSMNLAAARVLSFKEINIGVKRLRDHSIYALIKPPFWRICFSISSSQIQPRKSYASTLKFVIISVAL